VTFDRDVIRVLRARCLPCHGEGGAAVRLTTYAEARPWARAIRDEVLARRMPPWLPHPSVGELEDDASLSPHARALLVAWADGGAPEGDPRDLPAEAPPAPPALGPIAGAVTRSVRGWYALPTGTTLHGLRPRAPRGASLEVVLVTASGAPRPLLWIPRFDPRLDYTYRLREPPRARAGDRLLVRGGTVEISLSAATDRTSPPPAR
jgi:hypothetical protein